MANPRPPLRRGSTASLELRELHHAGAPRKRAVRSGPPPLSRTAARVSAVFFLVGTGLGVGAIFPTDTVGAPPDSANLSEVLMHVVPLAAWLIGGLIMLVGRRGWVRAGAALAAGSVIVFTGQDIVNASGLIGSHVSLGLGFWLNVGANVVGAVGAVVAFFVLRRSGELGAPSRIRPLWLAPVVIGAAAVAVGYVPPWQHVHYIIGSQHNKAGTVPISGQFDARWEVIVGQVIVMIGAVAIPVIASQWGRLRAGGAMIIGAVVGLGGFVSYVVVQKLRPLSQFSKAELKVLKQDKVRYLIHFNDWFYIVLAGMAVLVVVGVVAVVRGGPDGTDA